MEKEDQKMGSRVDKYLPVVAMVLLQVIYAGIAIGTRTVLVDGMSPRVFVVYRQLMATLVIVPVAYFSGRNSGSWSLSFRSFCLIFLASLIGVTLNQNLLYEGLYLVSSSIASAMANLLPALTFLIAALLRMESVNIGSWRGIAKIVGTVTCVSGAVSMALLKGPKLLNNSQKLPPSNSLLIGLGGPDNNWFLGCLFLFGSSFCWSLWLILQVPASASHPNHLSLSAWMCLMAALQSGAVTLFLEPHPAAWKFHTLLEFASTVYAGVMGSAVSFFVQAWCISRRGPLFSAMFTPLYTVITTIFAAIMLHETLYTGRENDQDSLRIIAERNTLLMGDDPARLYRLDGVAHIAGVIDEEPQRCIRSMRRQQGMRLDERYVPYLQMAGLYHLARLNDRWFRLDEALVSAFVERWRPETHTFHMPFGECTITLQDVAYQLGLPVDGRYVSGCLSEFHIYMPGGRPAWVWFQELLGVIPPPSQVQKYAVNCTWFQETFGECPEDADDETVRRYARAYIMMLLGTQLFADKSGNRVHIRWLPYVARLEEMGTYSWGSAALAWLYRCMCRVANRHVVKLAGPLQLLQSWIFWRFPRFRPSGYAESSWPLASRWSGYNPSGSEKGPRVEMWRLRIDMLQDGEFLWMPYTTPDVLQVVHPEVLEPRHMALWRSVTALIYFAVIEWHQVDRVLPQFGGVQPIPHPALNIDFLMSKDGRGGDRWFPSTLQRWHLLWDSRQDSVLRFDVVGDPGPSHAFLDWWRQYGKRFLSPESQLGDPRAVPIPFEASQRGPGRVPDMDRQEDVPDRRRVDRRIGVGTRRSQREWRWPDLGLHDDYDAGPPRGGGRGRRGRARGRPDHRDDTDDQHRPVGGGGSGAAASARTTTHDHGHAAEMYGTGMGAGAYTGDAVLGSGPLGDYFVGVPADDQPEQGGTPWRISGSQWSDFIGSDTLVGDFGSPRFLDEISAIMQGEATPRSGGQTSGTQAPLDVDLNEPPSSSAAHQFRLGGTPPSAFTAASQSVAGISATPLHVAPPAQPAPSDDEDDIEDVEPLIRRGQRARVPPRCGTGSHLFR